MGKLFILIGIIFIVIGIITMIAPFIPWLGRLPGDVRYEGRNISIYFPIVTCIILSVILTILLNLFGGWK